ncbi:hypothetical protein [Nitrosophilus alvini]|uniref:hypothetical protein n=1 Tax=Nitrosophilus alvini TaxID=2714855 RepID=UPI00190D4DC7|nr:hypothetical protein [Nitrosophilus alvini]
MRKLFIFFIVSVYLIAAEHIARIEPYEIYSFKSAVSGKVVFANIDKEGSVATKEAIIKIDSYLDKEQLKKSLNRFKNLEKIYKTNVEIEKNLEKLAKIKKSNFERIKDLKTKSKFEKDLKLAEYIAADNQLLSQREKIENLKNQIDDVLYQIEQLKDSISKKNVTAEGLYIYKIYVKKNDFVNPGAKLFDAADISKGKIIIYLSAEELENIENKKIYINGKETNYKISKIWRVADNVHISAYRAEIVVATPEVFSVLAKVELK